jgi:hypothetical protein
MFAMEIKLPRKGLPRYDGVSALPLSLLKPAGEGSIELIKSANGKHMGGIEHGNQWEDEVAVEYGVPAGR